MIDLLKVDSLDEAKEKLLFECKKANFACDTEEISIAFAIGRVLAEDVKSKINVPDFNRSIVDGYAVIASDTNAANDSVPVFLNIVGESKMGEECLAEIKSGECVYVPTGGMIPKSATAAIPIENTENFGENKIVVYSAVGDSKNLIFAGDDTKLGDVVLSKGKRITPADLGLLSSIDVDKVKVYKKLNIVIISTGDELVSSGEKLSKGKIKDVNTAVLVSLAQEIGFNVTNKFLIKDNENELRKLISDSALNNDIVITSGGSSKGKKDSTSKLINEIASTGVLTHGIAIKPGKPTITGFDHKTKTMLIGLPGHPVASAVLFNMLVVSIYNALVGSKQKELKCEGIMSENIASSPGCMTIRLVNIDENFNISLIYGKSGLIHTLSHADGYIILDKDCEGINKGDRVTVYYI